MKGKREEEKGKELDEEENGRKHGGRKEDRKGGVKGKGRKGKVIVVVKGKWRSVEEGQDGM